MSQVTPTPLPDQGAAFELLILFGYLYVVVALLAAGTIVALGLTRLRGRVPTPLYYLQLTVLVGALLIAGFTLLVAYTSDILEIVGFLLLVVYLPVTLGAVRVRRVTDDSIEVIAASAMAWCVPFLVGLGGFFVLADPDSSPLLVLGGVVGVLVVVGTVLAADQLAARLFGRPVSPPGEG